MSDRLAPPRVLPIEQGGTNARTREGARENLDVPSLSGNNTFAGDNTFTNDSIFTYSVTMTGDLEVAGTALIGALEVGVPTWNSGFYLGYIARTSDYTITPSTGIVHCTSGSFTVTLPTAVGCASRLHVIKNSGAGTITLATTAGQTIDGGAPGTVVAGAVIRLVSDGANWFTI